MHIITDLNTLCNNCGFFESESRINSGYGCKHKDCGDGEWMDKNGNYINNLDAKIALSLTNRNIRCSKRLAKKYWKGVKAMSEDERSKHLDKLGIKFYGKCYSFSCPISTEVSFEEINSYDNGKDFDHIENEKDMPWGFGEELMGLESEEADKMYISY